MQYAPWRLIANWKCLSCGDCCQLYDVVLNFHEWLKIVKSFGVEHTASDLNRFFLKRRSNGSCLFLCKYLDTYACGLQCTKPKACQLWPFKIMSQPTFGNAKEAAYHHKGQCLFVYADPMCNGIKYGTPSWDFAHLTLREFAEIAIGLRKDQFRTTGNISFPRPVVGLRGRRHLL